MPKMIGGPADGRIQEWDRNTIIIDTLDNRPWTWLEKDVSPMSQVTTERHVYKRMKIMGENRVFEVFVPMEWTADDLLMELIERA